MPRGSASENRFLTAPVGGLFLANALPMMLVMSMSGLLNIADAAFLGHFVGTGALAAVSIVFPPVMSLTALSALVSGGMSSLLARHLGAGAREAAAAVFASAHGLALCIAAVLIALLAVTGEPAAARLAGGDAAIAAMAHTYLTIMIWASPVQFLLGIHADACRNEGRAGLMALMSAGVALCNAALNYLLIAVLDFGVAGSAWGTVLAQALGLALLAGLRLRTHSAVPLAALARHPWTRGWCSIAALGAPLSLSFIGIAFAAASVIAALRATAGPEYAETAAAYGIVTRIFGLAFLPLMAIALAAQSIAGNNVGAGLRCRSDAVLRLAVIAALAYCAAVEAVLLGGSRFIGAGFTGDPAVAEAVGVILRPMASAYAAAGPVLVLAMYFQAVGQPGRAAALTLIKPFLLAPALIAALAAWAGADAIWYAFPAADCAVAVLAAMIAVAAMKSRGNRAGFGLAAAEGAG
ncbi:MATE family efflux transporter [Roseobacteraceae bacterium NS-SX3]